MAAPAALPEFKGNVFAVHTAKYYDEKLSDLIDRGWRWMNPKWDPEKKYVELAKKLKPLQAELNEAKKIKDRQERNKKTAAIQKKMDAIKYTPEEKAYIDGNNCSQGFHYFGSAKMFGQFFPQRLAQIGHLFETACKLQVEPLEHLVCPETPYVLIFKPITQILPGKIQ